MPFFARSFVCTALIPLTLLTLTACGGGGGDSSPTPVVPPVNKAPTIGLSNVEVQANTTISLSAQAQDSDGTVESYQWQQVSGEQVALSGIDISTLSFDSPNLSQNVTLVFSLTVIDDDGVGTTKEVTVTVIANEAPIIALEDLVIQTTGANEIAAQAQDSDGDIASYTWSQISGPDLVLSNTEGELLTFTAPSILQEAQVVLRLIVTDDDGATASKDITLTLIPNTQAFTVSGKVFTNTITFKNSPVTATIGNQSFSTTTNELGQYSLNIGALSNQLLDQMVTISATGVASNSVIKLVSYVDDLRSLIAFSEQNGGTITQSELARLNVTSISSAAAALMDRDNGESSPSTKEDYLTLERNFSSEHLMLTALLIDNVIDAVSTQSTVPDVVNKNSFNNIYDFIINTDNARSLYYDIAPSDNDIDMFAKVINSSSELVSSLAHFENFQSQRTFYTAIGKLTLKDDGEGQLISELAGKQSITWQQSESGLSVLLSEPKFQSSIYSDTVEYGNANLDEYLSGYQMNISFDGITRDDILVTPQYTYQAISYNNAPATVNSEPKVINYNSFERDSVIDLSTKISATSSYVVDFIHPNATKFVNYQSELTASSFSSMTLTFSSDTQVSIGLDVNDENTGAISSQSSEAIWSFKNNELEITNEEWLITIAGLSLFNDTQTQVLVTAQNAQDEQTYYSSYQGSMYEKISPAHEWSTDNVAGVYQYFTNNEEIEPLDTSWYELRADGTLSYIFLYTNESGPLQEIGQDNISESPGLWRIIDDKLIIRRYRYNRGLVDSYQRCHSEVWETNEDSECILYFQREWQLHSKFEDNGTPRELIQQRSQYYFDYQRPSLDEQSTPDGQLLYSVTSLNSHFVKRESRPVDLPNDYVLIKDDAPRQHTGDVDRSTKKQAFQ
jgi:K319L-like, PKD domain